MCTVTSEGFAAGSHLGVKFAHFVGVGVGFRFPVFRLGLGRLFSLGLGQVFPLGLLDCACLLSCVGLLWFDESEILLWVSPLRNGLKVHQADERRY